MMTQEEAKALIAASGLVEAAHTELPQVQALLEANPALIEAMNALQPRTGEETPQRAAAHCRKVDILKYFLSKGVQPDAFIAVALGMHQDVNAFLLGHPQEVNAKGAHGIALMVHANDAAMVKILIERGADPSEALAQLSWSGRVELMQVALAKGADVNLPKVGRRPLHIAAAQGHLPAVELLLSHGAEITARSKGAEWESKTPLALAIMNNHAEVVAVLRKVVAKWEAEHPRPQRGRGPMPQGRPGFGGGFRGSR